MTRRPSPGEQGFAMPLLLVTIALMALSVLVAAGTADDLGTSLDRVRAETALEMEAMTAESRVAHLMLTEPMGQRGLRVGGPRLGADNMLVSSERIWREASGRRVAPMPFDGRPWTGAGLVLTVQDEAGLINLNSQDEQAVQRLLTGLGVAAAPARRFAAALADYVDGDDLVRGGGAERRDYARAARDTPRNAPIPSERVLPLVLGWQELIAPPQRHAMAHLVTALPVDQPFNLNTAPAPALRAVSGLDERAARRLIAARETESLQSYLDVATATGAQLAGGITEVGGLPSRRVRFTAWRDGDAHRSAYRSRITIAMDEADRPFAIDLAPPATIPFPQDGGTSHDEAQPLPVSPALLAAHRG